MAMTLVQYWQQERDTYEAAETAAQNDLAAAQLALVGAKAALDVDVAALNTLNASIAANRAKLATTSVPSQVTALNNTIRDQNIQARALQGTILDDGDTMADAQANADAATAALVRATKNVADAEAQLAAAKDANKQRQLLKAQLGLAPLSTLQTDATTFHAGAEATKAKAEIDATFPAALETIASKRYTTRANRAAQLRTSLSDAENALGDALAANDGLAGDAAKKEVAFRHADQALRDYATTAKQRYDRSVAVFTSLQQMKDGTLTPDLLTAQEKTDVAQTADRATAEGNAEPIDTSRNALYTAMDTLDKQIVTQIDADVDALATDATVKAKRQAVTDAIGALATAENGLSQDDRTRLGQWEAIVQDPVWHALVDYLDADATLQELKGVAPASFGTALDTAEDAYATALAKASKAQRQADALGGVIALRARRVQTTAATLPGRLLSAVRGDSF